MNTEKYETAIDLAKKYGFWGLPQTAMDSNLDHITPYMVERVFIAASEAFDDESASKLFTVLMRALDDNKLIPFTEKKGDHRVIFHSSRRKEIEEARLRARSMRVLKAMELFKKLPDDSDIGRIAVPETKKAILKEIAFWWRDTEDEEEADKIRDFLKDVFSCFPLQSLKDNFLNEVIKKATDKEFPTERLMRHFVCLVPSGVSSYHCQHDAMAGELIRAWARNSDLLEVSRIFQAVHPLIKHFRMSQSDNPGSAFDFLERLSSGVVDLDRKAQELKRAMKLGLGSLVSLTDAEKRHFVGLREQGFEGVPGEIKITYPELNHLSVLVEARSEVGPFSISFDDEQGHAWFEIANKHVLRIKQKYPRVKIDLKLVVRSRYDYEGRKPLFERSKS